MTLPLVRGLLGRPSWAEYGVACGLLATAAAQAMRYAVKGRDSQVFAASVSRGPGRRRSVALTFDDGPAPASLEVAALLAREGIHATFFQCGANVERHPEIARALIEAGHEVGNHTFSHRRLCPRLGWRLNVLSAETVYGEFARAQEMIVQATGVVPRLMRAPYGLRWRGMREAQRRLGLQHVSWTAIGHDWVWDGARVAAHLAERATAGAILCLHDGRDTTVSPNIDSTLTALELLIPSLRAAGFSFETVSELLV